MNDFTLDTMEIIIAPGNLPITMGNCLMVTAIDDSLVEGDHEFDINIASTSNDQQIDIVDPSVNTVTITDNDGMYMILCILLSIYFIYINLLLQE